MADHRGDVGSGAGLDAVIVPDFDVFVAVMAYCFLYRERMLELR